MRSSDFNRLTSIVDPSETLTSWREVRLQAQLKPSFARSMLPERHRGLPPVRDEIILVFILVGVYNEAATRHTSSELSSGSTVGELRGAVTVRSKAPQDRMRFFINPVEGLTFIELHI
jgi:hypothetical protein